MLLLHRVQLRSQLFILGQLCGVLVVHVIQVADYFLVLALHTGHFLPPLIALCVFLSFKHFGLALNAALFFFEDADFVAPMAAF